MPCSSCRVTPASGRRHWSPRPPGAPPRRAPACSWDVARKTSARHMRPSPRRCTITWRMRPSTCFEPTSRPTAATSHRWSLRSVNDWGTVPAPTRTDPDTERYLLYGAVAGLLDRRLRAPTNRARARRLAMVGQSKPPTPASSRHAPSSRHGYSCSGRFATPSSRLPTRSVISSVPCNANQISAGSS